VNGYSKFKDIVQSNTYFMGSAAEAITFYLTNHALDQNAVVGVPLYTCSSVLQAVKSANCKIKLLDIYLDQEGYHYDLAQIESIDVLILIHYFGVYCKEISAIKDAYPNLSILEDCSHLAFRKEKVSVYSDASVFSFNLHKPISCGSGGCLLVNDSQNNCSLRDSYSNLPTYNLLVDTKIYINKLIKNFAHISIIQSAIRNIVERRRKKQSQVSPYHSIFPHRLSFLSKCLLGNQYYVRNRAILKLNYLKIPDRCRLSLNDEEIYNLLYYPIYLANKEQRDFVNTMLHSLHIDSFVLWENCVYNASYYVDIKDDTQGTEEFLKKVLFLPKALIEKERYSAELSLAIDILKKTELKE
jgi:hypothetical protein